MIGISPENLEEKLPAFRPCMQKPLIMYAIEMPDDFIFQNESVRLSGKKGDYLLRSIDGHYEVLPRSAFLTSYIFFGDGHG